MFQFIHHWLHVHRLCWLEAPILSNIYHEDLSELPNSHHPIRELHETKIVIVCAIAQAQLHINRDARNSH